MDMQAIIKHKLSYFQQVQKEIDSRKTKARKPVHLCYEDIGYRSKLFTIIKTNMIALEAF